MARKDIGALWLREGRNMKFMSGKLEIDGKKIDIIVFKNHYKDSEKKPDYLIYPSEPKTAKPRNSHDKPQDFNESDIPF